MSILIEGMEMPKEGSWVTLRVFPDGQCVLHSWCGNDEIKFDFMEHLTAVPVPPHGRLIDGGALFEEVFKVWGIEYDASDCNTLMRLINDAPTIIPASEEV